MPYGRYRWDSPRDTWPNAAAVVRAAFTYLRAPGRLLPAAWADEHRNLDRSNAEPGRWRTSRTPYLREIMDNLAPDSGVEVCVLQKAAQLGGSEVVLNACGFFMHHAPCTIMLVEPTTEVAKRFSKGRVDSLIETTSVLRGLVRRRSARNSGNTVLQKSFVGGNLVLSGANSAVTLRSTPVKVLLCDEVDGWPVDVAKEGDPFHLALERTASFGTQKKVLVVSTPTLESTSRIAALYRQSDQRKYFVPCPACQARQALRWEQLTWDEADPMGTTRYRCESCGHLIESREKFAMLAGGEWVPTAAGDGRVRGYHLSGLYSPWLGWDELVRAYLVAKPWKERLQVFTNCTLGETWKEEETEPLAADVLMQRREVYRAEVPQGAVLLVAGIDVQDNRLEIEILGVGRDEECWSISYHVLYGDPALSDVWNELDAILTRSYRHESGFQLTVQAACIDSGGHHSAAVYEFCRPRYGRKVWAAKGISGFARPIFPRKPTKGYTKAPLQMIGVDPCKEKTYSRLRVETPGAAFCHFPMSYQREYFEQLCAEVLTVRYKAGRADRGWINPLRRPNHSLDCRVLCLAALHGLYQHGVRLADLAERFEAMQKPHTDQQPTKVYSKFLYPNGPPR